MWRIDDRSASQYVMYLWEESKVPLCHFFAGLHACSALPMPVDNLVIFLFSAFSLSLHCLTVPGTREQLVRSWSCGRCGHPCRPPAVPPEQLHTNTHSKRATTSSSVHVSPHGAIFNTLVSQIHVGRTHLASRGVTRILIRVNPGSTPNVNALIRIRSGSNLD